MTAIPFFDRTRVDAPLEAELTEVFQRVLRSGRYILGQEVEAFEAACAAYLNVSCAVGVSSGTDALIVALSAHGIGPGDEVICPAFTFAATALAVARVGARPVFADIDAASFLLDPASVSAVTTARTRAIVAVHLFGRCAPMDALHALAAPRGIAVIEDAAQAFGADLGGTRAGALGTVGCFSLFPTKNLGGFGDGGLVTTPDTALAERARVLRAQGTRRKYHHELVGGNFRLDALQAALLRRMLPHLDARLAMRRHLAARYDALLASAGVPVSAPSLSPGHTYNQYVVRVHGGQRDALRAFLAARGVGTEVYYPEPLHVQPCFAGPGAVAGPSAAETSLPVAEAATREALALPIFPGLTEEEVTRVVAEIAAFPGWSST
ncbi:DegT/DnrJ/EryC1/StrS family aminotransferase [Chondromyces apiculatus]|uniref:Pleiotropic regulatory protein n=1 Tax=Chondromyces apiculatus DSM 436 TaxID=1192034 RepID=A0A017T2P7_9BACT|nr:DegT/DnrJ/EryC1/StrS family aminotransferase [Chondromyces apiculatus]EYF03272.1 Pleiotropic regulatory protein [Chondromyces apiculatus DSM 436]